MGSGELSAGYNGVLGRKVVGMTRFMCLCSHFKGNTWCDAEVLCRTTRYY